MYISVYESNNGTLAIECERADGKTYKAVYDADHDGYVDEAAQDYLLIEDGADPIAEGWDASEADLSDGVEIVFFWGGGQAVYQRRCGNAGLAFLEAVDLYDDEEE